MTIKRHVDTLKALTDRASAAMDKHTEITAVIDRVASQGVYPEPTLLLDLGERGQIRLAIPGGGGVEELLRVTAVPLANEAAVEMLKVCREISLVAEEACSGLQAALGEAGVSAETLFGRIDSKGDREPPQTAAVPDTPAPKPPTTEAITPVASAVPPRVRRILPQTGG